MQWESILGHQDNLAPLIPSYLLHKFLECPSVRDVDDCVRFASVTVPACDDWKIERLGHLDDLFVLRPRSESIDLECVNPRPHLEEEMREKVLVSLLPHELDVPKRVIENDQYLVMLVQHREQFAESRVVLTLSVECVIEKLLCDFFGFLFRKIVHTDMEESVFERNSPLE